MEHDRADGHAVAAGPTGSRRMPRLRSGVAARAAQVARTLSQLFPLGVGFGVGYAISSWVGSE